jgi:ribonuclease Z
VILLGTGTPAPIHSTQGPATAVTVGPRIFLFDAGPGVERQMQAAGLPYRDGPVTAAFLTHLHSDHTLGLPDLIFTSWVMGRRRPLTLVGPPGTRRMVEHIMPPERGYRYSHARARTRPEGWRTDVRETRGGIGTTRRRAHPRVPGGARQLEGRSVTA